MSESNNDSRVNIVTVLYRNSWPEVESLMLTLLDAAERAGLSATATIVVNDDQDVSWDDHRGTVIRGHGNVGFAAAVSMGIKLNPTEFSLIVNPDCIVAPADAYAYMCDLATTDGILIPLLEKSKGDVDLHIYESWVFTPSRRLSRIACRRFLLHSKKELLPRFVKAPGTFIGMRTHLAIRFDSPFDSEFYLYGEDRDLTMRLRAAHVPLRLTRKARVLHPGGGSSDGGRELIERAKTDGMLRIAFRRYGRIGLRLMTWNLIVEARLKDALRGSQLREPRRWAIARWCQMATLPPPPLTSHLLAGVAEEKTGSHE